MDFANKMFEITGVGSANCSKHYHQYFELPADTNQ